MASTTELLGPEPLTHSDLQLVSVAIKERWNIPAKILHALPLKLAQDALNINDDGSPSTVDLESQHRAAALLLRMVAHNATSGAPVQPIQIQHTGPGGGPIQVSHGDISIDVSKLSIAESEALQKILEQELQIKNPISIDHADIQENTESMDKE